MAKDQIAPLVAKMDEANELDKAVIQTLFDNGLMGIETPVEYGGSGCNFMTSMLVVSYCVLFVNFFRCVLWKRWNSIIIRIFNMIILFAGR